jgi:C_GCAxxG_C_C family probable redox protein
MELPTGYGGTTDAEAAPEAGTATDAATATQDGSGVETASRAARRMFLDEDAGYGCAEATFVALKGAYGLGDAADPSAAMALNGGVAYGGGTCGALTGAALAVGLLAGHRLADHAAAKRVARELTARVMDDFRAAHGAVDCRDLIGLDLRVPGAHDVFIESGAWRVGCVEQIAFVVERLAPLGDREAWERAVAALDEERA